MEVEFIECTKPHYPAALLWLVWLPLCEWGSAGGRSADPCLCVVPAQPGTEPTRLCTAGSHRCPGSLVENKQVLCQCCQKNMQLLSAPITRRRWITSLHSVPGGTLAAGRQLWAGVSPACCQAHCFSTSSILRFPEVEKPYSISLLPDPWTSTCSLLPWCFSYS